MEPNSHWWWSNPHRAAFSWADGGDGGATLVATWHHRYLPPPLDRVASVVLWENVERADERLAALLVVLLVAAVVQLRAFQRPPPVPAKRLPRRPLLQIQFRPDDPVAAAAQQLLLLRGTAPGSGGTAATTVRGSSSGAVPPSATATASASVVDDNREGANSYSPPAAHQHDASTALPKSASFVRRIDRVSRRLLFGRSSALAAAGETTAVTTATAADGTEGFVETVPDGDDDDELLLSGVDDGGDEDEDAQEMLSARGRAASTDEDTATHEPPPPPLMEDAGSNNKTSSADFTWSVHDCLPDSFAPLLSSSHTQLLAQQLTADLLHAATADAEIRLRPGRHEVPLDKDGSRPQLVLQVPSDTGCRLTAVAAVGSDGLSSAQDLDVRRPTPHRSKPMVKHAGIVLDPPLPLLNVAPTLIHFPTLFEDRHTIPTLRRVQIVRFLMDFVVSISAFLEKCLWILESQCQIHLSKVRITPLYKGREKRPRRGGRNNRESDVEEDDEEEEEDGAAATSSQQQKKHPVSSPEWRLQLAFSGHVLLFGWVPVPFVSVTLPTFIIPQPHALLDYLLSSQPLASARLRRENIAEQRIALAVLNTVETWSTEVKLVATPPAVGVDVTLPGGVAIAMEMGLWRDHQAGRTREGGGAAAAATKHPHSQSGLSPVDTVGDDGAASVNSMSSWTTRNETHTTRNDPAGSNRRHGAAAYVSSVPPFDANHLVPWLLELSLKGSISHEKMSVHVLKASAKHEGSPPGAAGNMLPAQKSQFATRGSFAVWKLSNPHRRSPSADSSHKNSSNLPGGSGSSPIPRRRKRPVGRSNSSHHQLATEDSPSVSAILLFPDETASFHNDLRMLQYDYVFDVFEDSKLDALTVSVGATHPMLNGGTMVTTILDSVYAFGSLAAREDSVLDPSERRRKRNILRHLPATDFTFGIQNVYIPPESDSYSDDGLSMFLPEVEGGRMMVRLLGGMDVNDNDNASVGSNLSVAEEAVYDGIKLVADFEIPSLVMNIESTVKEFPELDIQENAKLHTFLSGVIGGSVKAHLRPQNLTSRPSTMGKNVFNPLEAYEVDFSRSSLSVKMREFSNTLGHRRVMFPAESTFQIQVIESVMDMGFEGKTKCDLSWDFQGLSPILQVTSPGESPVDAPPENKSQASLLVSPLRQGRFSLSVSPVGGISITKAATSREDKEGLYDWKFFNALVSPDEESMGRLLDVLHDKRTVDKLLQIVSLLNEDLHKICRYSIKQLWRAKEIFDQEGVSDPGHAIPMYKMARLCSLFLTGDIKQVDTVLPVIRKVVQGEGLDVVKVKDLLRQHVELYDTYASEIDRAVRWAAVAFGPVSVPHPYVEDNVTPLAELPRNAVKFRNIPTAAQLYERLLDKPHLPLDPAFSNLISRIAPYLSFRQVEYILETRSSSDWQPADLRRVRYVYSIKRKVLEIAECYGGLSFLPQSFYLSVFLGEATRTSLRASRAPLQAMQKVTKRSSASLSLSRKSVPSKTRRSTQSTLGRLRRRRVSPAETLLPDVTEEDEPTPAERVASSHNMSAGKPQALKSKLAVPSKVLVSSRSSLEEEQYNLGDSLLGPQDVAILLQAGLTSVMKTSSVVQLNQRMLLDLICSQSREFAIAVLAEIGTNCRALTSALMALLEMDQTAFKPSHRIDMHALIETWLPGLKIPRREDHMAGGRWARQSYYDAIYSVAGVIIDDSETYMALKSHLQRVRPMTEQDPLPKPRDEPIDEDGLDISGRSYDDTSSDKLKKAIEEAIARIEAADDAGRAIRDQLFEDEAKAMASEEYDQAISLYRVAFDACARVLEMDKHAFYAPWFRDFYKRNYDALMIKSMFDNVVDNVDQVRHWLDALLRGAKKVNDALPKKGDQEWIDMPTRRLNFPDDVFITPENARQQDLIDAIIESTIYEVSDRERLQMDPLVRLLIDNPPGHYDFTIVLAAGVITEGKQGLELKNAFERLESKRGIKVIRSDTATARSLEYNAGKVEEAIELAMQMKKPYGLLGYSQGCANALTAESLLLSGTPKQQQALSKLNGGLVCRQLLFSACNGSFHGPAMDKKVQQLISLCEDFFKSQAGYFSRAFTSTVLELLNSLLDSAAFHKTMGGAQSFLPDGCRAFWREGQHLSCVPTCTLRGVMEKHTTPESLEMLSNLLTKQSGSPLHDSQVHVFDAVGYPVYQINRNGRMLRRCAVGDGAIQRTHHWSPLSDEVEFVETAKDVEMASFDCAKDRHVFPWIEVNRRFGFIKLLHEQTPKKMMRSGAHPSKLLSAANTCPKDYTSEEE